MYGTTELLRTPHAPSSSAYVCFRNDTQKKDNTQLLPTLSTHMMSAILQNWDATLGPQIGSHFFWVLHYVRSWSQSRLLDRVQFLFKFIPQLQAFSIDPIEPWTFPLHTSKIWMCSSNIALHLPPATSVLHFLSLRFGSSFHMLQLQLKTSLVNWRNLNSKAQSEVHPKICSLHCRQVYNPQLPLNHMIWSFIILRSGLGLSAFPC